MTQPNRYKKVGRIPKWLRPVWNELLADEAGSWQCVRTRGDHIRLLGPRGEMVTMSSTPTNAEEMARRVASKVRHEMRKTRRLSDRRVRSSAFRVF